VEASVDTAPRAELGKDECGTTDDEAAGRAGWYVI
jgi:hypothetical protein